MHSANNSTVDREKKWTDLSSKSKYSNKYNTSFNNTNDTSLPENRLKRALMSNHTNSLKIYNEDIEESERTGDGTTQFKVASPNASASKTKSMNLAAKTSQINKDYKSVNTKALVVDEVVEYSWEEDKFSKMSSEQDDEVVNVSDCDQNMMVK